MSNSFKGKVQRVIVKPTRTGGKLFLLGFPGEDNLFNAGFKNPGVSEGDVVSFNWDETAFGKGITKAGVEIIRNGDADTDDDAPNTPPVNKYKSTAQKEWGHKCRCDACLEADKKVQDSINYQSARRDAIEVSKFLVEGGYAPLGTSKKKQMDNFLHTVNEVTDHFFSRITSVLNEEIDDVDDDDLEIENVEE